MCAKLAGSGREDDIDTQRSSWPYQPPPARRTTGGTAVTSRGPVTWQDRSGVGRRVGLAAATGEEGDSAARVWPSVPARPWSACNEHEATGTATARASTDANCWATRDTATLP